MAMTYRDLRENMATMTEEELEQNVAIHMKGIGEFLPAIETDRVNDSDILDPGHFVINV